MVQMDHMSRLEPNWRTDPEFSRTLCLAAEAGVQVRAFGCHVRPQGLEIASELPVHLDVQET